MEKNDDLQGKYLRLGQEFQKARAQVTVLKKAVIDEQAANKTLQDAVKQRDQSLRKYEQDIDSLQFRNSQLSKRVEVLQSELDKYERRGSKQSKSSSQNNSVSFVHEQELQLKIAENESLHKQLHEANQLYQSTKQQLETRLEILEKDKENYEKAIEDCNSKNNSIVERLKEEQQVLELKYHKLEEEFKISNILSDKYKQQLKNLQEESRAKLEETSKIIQEKIPIQDTNRNELNRLNLPICDRNYQHNAKLFMEVLVNQLIVFIASMSDYQTYLEQRLRVYSLDMKQEEISSTTSKFCGYLLENASYTRKVQRSLTNLLEEANKETYIYLESLPSLKSFLQSFNVYLKYLEKLLPYRILSLEEESHSNTWSENLEKCNKKLAQEEKKLNAQLLKIFSYVSVILKKGSERSLATCVRNLCSILKQLSNTYKSIFKIHSERTSEEHNFPTYTERLKITDDCILSKLHSLENISAKIYQVFEENLDFMTSPHPFKRKGLQVNLKEKYEPDIKEFFNRATSYMQIIQQEPCLTVPYEKAVKNYRRMVTAIDQQDSYAKQTELAQQALVQLEQEKEHWLLETQLLSAKYEKEVKKTQMLAEELKKSQTELLSKNTSIEENLIDIEVKSISRSINSSVSSIAETPTQAIPIGTVDVFSKEKTNAHSHEHDHEKLMKEHFTNRITQLTKQLQMSDSKAINFYHEAHALYKQIILADKTKKKLTNELNECNKKIENLQDELETTKKSYEEQLRTLTDHLCGMNEKLTSQKDEIDVLKTVGSTNAQKRFGRKK